MHLDMVGDSLDDAGMKRSRFLFVGALAMTGLATGTSAVQRIAAANLPLSATPPLPAKLATWMQTQGAHFSQRNGLLRIKARIAVGDLQKALADFSRVADTDLHAKGNQLSGSCEGLPFELLLKA